MNIIVFAMLLGFATLLIFKFTTLLWSFKVPTYGILLAPELPVMGNSYPGFKKEIFLLNDQKEIMPGYFENNNTFKHNRYYTKKHLT